MKRFGDTVALGGVTVEAAPGSFVAVVGPSGCGKTTLLRVLAGLETPDAGRVTLDGRDLARRPPHERGFGIVFQEGALFPHLTVEENVAFGLRARDVDRPRALVRAREALDLVRALPLARRRVEGLSGGEAQRVALARALAPRPRVLLLDEPFASLDRELREGLRREVRRLHRALGLATIYVTHDRDEALGLADRVVVLREGRVEADATPRALVEEPESPFAARFLGTWNVVAARVRDGVADGSLGRVPVRAPDGEGSLLVRPTALVATADPGGTWEVLEARPGGSSVAVGRGGEVLESRAATPLAVGDRVSLRVEGEVRFLSAAR